MIIEFVLLCYKRGLNEWLKCFLNIEELDLNFLFFIIYIWNVFEDRI